MFSKSLKNQKRQIGHRIFFARKKIKEDTLNIIWCKEPITAKCVFVAEFGFLGYQKREFLIEYDDLAYFKKISI